MRLAAPLIFLFACLICLVAGSFALLVYLLTAAQMADTRLSVDTQLRGAHAWTSETILHRLHPVAARADELAARTWFKPDGRSPLTDTGDTATYQAFHDDAFPALAADPQALVTAFAFKYDQPDSRGRVGVNMISLTRDAFILSSNSTTFEYAAPTGAGWPTANLGSIYLRQMTPQSAVDYIGAEPLRPTPGAPGVWCPPDTGATALRYSVASLTTTVNGAAAARASVVLRVPSIFSWSLLSAVAFGDATVVALVSAVTGGVVTGARLPFSLPSPGSPAYLANATESDAFNAAFVNALASCPAATCNSTTLTYDDNIVSIGHIPVPGSPLILLTYTPDSYFFGVTRTRLVNSILADVGLTVFLTIASIVMWVMIKWQICLLKGYMQKAAVMKNQEVVDEIGTSQGGLILELCQLQDAFMGMNAKLLQARPFLPQSLLASGDSEGEAEDLEEELGDEGSEIDDDASAIGTESSRLDIGGTLAESVARNASVCDAMDESGRSGKSGHSSFTGGNAGSQRKKRSMTRHGTQSNSVRSGKPTTEIKTDRALVARRVSVLVVNARGFQRVLSGSGSLIESHGWLVGQVLGAAQAARGVVDHFSGDHFTVTFNASRLVGTPSRSAAQCAILLNEAVRSGRREFATGLTMGASTSKAHVGNCGTDSMRKFCTLGRAVGDAVRLEMAAQQGVQVDGPLAGFVDCTSMCLTSGTLVTDVDLTIATAVVGNITLDRSGTVSAAALLVGTRNAGKGDEWLYEVDKQENAEDPLSKLNSLVLTAAGKKTPPMDVSCFSGLTHTADSTGVTPRDRQASDAEILAAAAEVMSKVAHLHDAETVLRGSCVLEGAGTPTSRAGSISRSRNQSISAMNMSMRSGASETQLHRVAHASHARLVAILKAPVEGRGMLSLNYEPQQ